MKKLIPVFSSAVVLLGTILGAPALAGAADKQPIKDAQLARLYVRLLGTSP